MPKLKRLGHAGVGKLGARDVAAMVASLAGTLGVCGLVYMLAG